MENTSQEKFTQSPKDDAAEKQKAAFTTKEVIGPHKENGNAKISPNSNGTLLTKSPPLHVFPTGEEKPSRKGLYMLSNLDQMFPFYIETMFVFERNNEANIDACKVLKESLGKALEEFYPLAGVMDVSWDGKMVVDCTTQNGGVPFVEAFCDEEMAAAVGDITAMDMKLANSLSIANPYQALDVPCLAVQVTTFKCGGIILGMRFNHALIDGRAFTDFMLSWCQIARGFPSSIHPHLDRSIISPRQPPQTHFSHTEYSKSKLPLVSLASTNYKPKHESITKSFCFTPNNLSRLKELSMQDNPKLIPTRFELISALFWICWAKAFKIEPDKTTQMLTAVDVRPKFNPPLPEYYFGNGIAAACAKSKATDLMMRPFSYAVKIVHEALIEVTEEYTRSEIDYLEKMRKPLEQEYTVWITKWTRLPLYEMDFRWGKPRQVAPASLIDNLIVCSPERKDSDNMIVSLSLPVDTMVLFEELMEKEMN